MNGVVRHDLIAPEEPLPRLGVVVVLGRQHLRADLYGIAVRERVARLGGNGEVGEKFDMPDAATAVTDSVRIFIPMDELIDKDKELARLKKEQEKVQKDLDFLSKKLSNQGFLAKAPEKLVEAEKAKLAKAQEKMDKIVQSMAALQ